MKFDISKYEAVSFTCALEMDKTRSASASHHAIDQYIFKTIRGQEVERINFILSIKGIFWNIFVLIDVPVIVSVTLLIQLCLR